MTSILNTPPTPAAAGGSAPRRAAGPWRVALLGAGYIAEWHAKALRLLDNVRLLAVCDRVLGRAEACARAFGIPQAYGSLEEMLQSERLDAVHVLLPPDLHFAVAMQLLDAGVHVLLEKPMCTSADDCRALTAHAAAKGLNLGVGHNFLFGDAYEQLRAAVKDGTLGPIDRVTITWNKELGQVTGGPFDIWMLREPGNIMLEIGAHSVAHMVDLVGSPDDLHVRATNPVVLPTGRPFYRRWQVDGYRGKTAIELCFSFVPGFSEHAIHVRGALGSATVDFERSTFSLRRHTPYGDDLDRYAMIRREATAARRQGWQSLRNYALAKFRLSRKGSTYGWSIAQSMRAFYGSIGGVPDSRIAGATGANVIEICERIGSQAGLPPARTVASPANATGASTTSPKVLVLGATGFIGRELVRELTARGHAVRVLARSPSKWPSDMRGPLVQITKGDLNSPDDLGQSLAGIDCVYHLARPFVKTWDDYQRYDIEVTRQIAESCLASGVKRLVYTGTIDSYYAGAKAGTITEETPLDPRINRRNLYARSKAVSEELLTKMHRERGLPVVIARPGIVIGRGGGPFHWGVGMWQHGFVCQVWGDGENKLPLVLGEDVARGLVALRDASDVEGQSFNFVAEPCLSAREYLDELERAGGLKLQRAAVPIYRFYLADMVKWSVKMLVRHPSRRLPSYRDWESRTQRAVFDCSKAKKQLGWNPTSDRAALVQKGIVEPLAEFLA